MFKTMFVMLISVIILTALWFNAEIQNAKRRSRRLRFCGVLTETITRVHSERWEHVRSQCRSCTGSGCERCSKKYRNLYFGN